MAVGCARSPTRGAIMALGCGEGSEPLVIFSQTQTRHARNICPRLARLLMILARPPAPNTPLVTLCSLQIRQHRRDRLDIRRPRRDHQMTITHFGLQTRFVGPVRRNEEMYCGPVLRHPTKLYVASRRPRWLSMAAAVQTGPWGPKAPARAETTYCELEANHCKARLSVNEAPIRLPFKNVRACP